MAISAAWGSKLLYIGWYKLKIKNKGADRVFLPSALKNYGLTYLSNSVRQNHPREFHLFFSSTYLYFIGMIACHSSSFMFLDFVFKCLRFYRLVFAIFGCTHLLIVI